MLRCPVESNSVVSYSWTRNRQPLVSSSRVLLHAHGAVLEVRALNRSDAGGYRCQAENRVGVIQSPPARLTVVNRDAQGGYSLDHHGPYGEHVPIWYNLCYVDIIHILIL